MLQIRTSDGEIFTMTPALLIEHLNLVRDFVTEYTCAETLVLSAVTSQAFADVLYCLTYGEYPFRANAERIASLFLALNYLQCNQDSLFCRALPVVKDWLVQAADKATFAQRFLLLNNWIPLLVHHMSYITDEVRSFYNRARPTTRHDDFITSVIVFLYYRQFNRDYPKEEQHEYDWALQHACTNGHARSVQVLLQYTNVDPERCESFALKHAVKNNYAEIVRLLLHWRPAAWITLKTNPLLYSCMFDPIFYAFTYSLDDILMHFLKDYRFKFWYCTDYKHSLSNFVEKYPEIAKHMEKHGIYKFGTGKCLVCDDAYTRLQNADNSLLVFYSNICYVLYFTLPNK